MGGGQVGGDLGQQGGGGGGKTTARGVERWAEKTALANRGGLLVVRRRYRGSTEKTMLLKRGWKIWGGGETPQKLGRETARREQQGLVKRTGRGGTLTEGGRRIGRDMGRVSQHRDYPSDGQSKGKGAKREKQRWKNNQGSAAKPWERITSCGCGEGDYKGTIGGYWKRRL